MTLLVTGKETSAYEMDAKTDPKTRDFRYKQYHNIAFTYNVLQIYNQFWT